MRRMKNATDENGPTLKFFTCLHDLNLIALFSIFNLKVEVKNAFFERNQSKLVSTLFKLCLKSFFIKFLSRFYLGKPVTPSTPPMSA